MIKFRSLKGKTLAWRYSVEAFAAFKSDIWPKVEAVPGLLSDLESFFLYETARTLGGKTRGIDVPNATHVVEIGSYKGRSSVAIALGLKQNDRCSLRLVCIDPFFDSELDPALKNEFSNNIKNANVDDIIDLVSKYSNDAIQDWPKHNGIAMLWIDGNHEYEFVKDDLMNWGRYLLPGGVIACHDWYLLGVRQAIEELIVNQPRYQNLGLIDGNLITAQKVDRPPSGRDRAIKMRSYWSIRSGHTGALIAIAMMLNDCISSVFGGLREFFTSTPDIQ